MATNTEAAKTFLAGVLAKLPEGLRAQAQAAFDDAQAIAALDELGQGVKRQEDYSRAMDLTNAEKTRAEQLYTQNKQWYDANSAEVQAAAQLRARVAELEGGEPKPPAAPPIAPIVDPSKYVSVEDFQAAISDSLDVFGSTLPELRDRHKELFGERLNTRELIIEAQNKKLTLEKWYEQKYATQLKAKADEAEAARVKTIEDAAIARFQREHPQMPYPSPRGGGGSPLDSLPKGAPVEPGANLVDEAVAAYNELVAQKAGA